MPTLPAADTHQPVLGALSVADAARLQALRQMRRLALGLLVLAAVIFALTYRRSGLWGYVNAGAEASMVGGMADWFAVTALFRHPLGLPIPHTALIPTRKDTLATGLEDFVRGNFLTPGVIGEKLAAADVAGRAGRWLADEQHAARVVAEAVPVLKSGLRRVRDEDVRALLDEHVVGRFTQEPLAPAAGTLLHSIVADRAHQPLVDVVAQEAYLWLLAHRSVVAEIISSKAPWWSPRFVDDLVVDKTHAELCRFLAEVRDDPDHGARRALDSYLDTLADNLLGDPATQAQAEDLKTRLLTNPGLLDALMSLWEVVRRETEAALDDDTGGLRSRLVQMLARTGDRLVEEPALRDKVNAAVSGAATGAVERYGPELVSVISSTIERWDGVEAADKVELHVGRDLQFIRINGTVVGGLVGVLIHALSQLL